MAVTMVRMSTFVDAGNIACFCPNIQMSRRHNCYPIFTRTLKDSISWSAITFARFPAVGPLCVIVEEMRTQHCNFRDHVPDS